MQPRVYNRTIPQLFGCRIVNGEYGVEVELEGRNLPRVEAFGEWTIHNDPSLRGESAEYVLRKPLEKNEIRANLEFLRETLKAHGAVISKDLSNCSVHVHKNMQKHSLQDVYKIAVAYFIVEDLLMEWCGQDRVGNLFCLRACDAEYLITALVRAIRSGQYAGLADDQEIRYAGINVTSLSKFGSLEFRGLRGTKEVDVICDWVDIIDTLCRSALVFRSPAEIVQSFSANGPQDFLKRVLKGSAHHFEGAADLNQRLYEGARIAQDVAFAVNWEEPVGPGQLKEVLEHDWVVKPKRNQRVQIDLEDIRRANEIMANARQAMNLRPNQPVDPLPLLWVRDENGNIREPGADWNQNGYRCINDNGVIKYWDRAAGFWKKANYQYKPPAAPWPAPPPPQPVAGFHVDEDDEMFLDEDEERNDDDD